MSAPQATTDFFAAIQPFERAYCSATIRYLAGRKDIGGPWSLLQAQIALDGHMGEFRPRTFETAHLRVGVFRATGAEFQPAALVETLRSGIFPVEDGTVIFGARDDGGGYDLQVLKSYPDLATNRQNRIGLRLGGGWTQNVATIHELGWELMSADPPYESLQELATAFGLGPVQQQNAIVELWTTPVLHFVDESDVLDTRARATIWLAPALDPKQVRFGRKVRNVDAALGGAIPGDTLTWDSRVDGHGAVVTFAVPRHAELLCTLGYAGVIQTFAIYRDQRAIRNERRMIYESVDPSLAKLAAALETFKVPEQKSDAFERLIVSLFWLAGFNPVHLGKDKRTERAADIVALTPTGDILLIEVTTGILKKDKRSQLLRRAQVVRETQLSLPSGAKTVIPLMVTCLPQVQAQSDVAEAEGDGIAIYTYEDLTDLLASNTQPPDPAARYSALQQRLVIAAMMRNETGRL
jgi:Holliday junction resolvase